MQLKLTPLIFQIRNYPDLLIGSIPEAISGVTRDHILSLMLEIEKQCFEFNLPLIGHCTDSAANSLNVLIKLQHQVKNSKVSLLLILQSLCLLICLIESSISLFSNQLLRKFISNSVNLLASNKFNRVCMNGLAG